MWDLVCLLPLVVVVLVRVRHLMHPLLDSLLQLLLVCKGGLLHQNIVSWVIDRMVTFNE